MADERDQRFILKKAASVDGLFPDHGIFEGNAFRVVLCNPCISGLPGSEYLQMIGMTDAVGCVDVDPDSNHRRFLAARFAFHFAFLSQGFGGGCRELKGSVRGFLIFSHRFERPDS